MTGNGDGTVAGEGPQITVLSQAPDSIDKRHKCQGRKVVRPGWWRVVQGRAPDGTYCDNAGPGRGRDAMRVTFRGDVLDVVFGRAMRGGKAVVFVDGERVGRVETGGRGDRPDGGWVLIAAATCRFMGGCAPPCSG